MSSLGDWWVSLIDSRGSLSSWALFLTFNFALSAYAGRETVRGGNTMIDGFVAGFAP